jgi:hypothetical protein
MRRKNAKKADPVVFVGTFREDFKKFARERATEKKGQILGLLGQSCLFRFIR